MNTSEATAIVHLSSTEAKSLSQPGASWAAKGGSFAGPLRVEKTACTMLPGETRVRNTDAGVVVDGKYDPPGTAGKSTTGC